MDPPVPNRRYQASESEEFEERIHPYHRVYTDHTAGEGSPTLVLKHNDSVVFDFHAQEHGAVMPTRKRRWIILGLLCALTFLVVLVSLDILLRLGKTAWLDDDNASEEEFCKWGKPGTGSEGLSWYPTDFLQDVTPKPIHSHNDYWRKVPLFTALRQGCISVETDVWHFDDPDHGDHLYVGHNRAALQPNRTFGSLYIQPLVGILQRQNPKTSFSNETGNGVFDTAPKQTLILLVDIKSAGPKTWATVVKHLEPLRERGWLTHVSNGTINERQVTVVGTGNTRFEDITHNTSYRDYFFDAPLDKLSDNAYNTGNSYYASTSFLSAIGKPWKGSLSIDQVHEIRTQVRQAHESGLKVRYWDLPEWPVKLRYKIWDVLVEEGVDVLNADDVKAAAKREWKY